MGQFGIVHTNGIRKQGFIFAVIHNPRNEETIVRKKEREKGGSGLYSLAVRGLRTIFTNNQFNDGQLRVRQLYRVGVMSMLRRRRIILLTKHDDV